MNLLICYFLKKPSTFTTNGYSPYIPWLLAFYKTCYKRTTVAKNLLQTHKKTRLTGRAYSLLMIYRNCTTTALWASIMTVL